MKKLPVVCLVDSSIYNSHEKLQATNIALELFSTLLSRDEHLQEICEVYFYTFSQYITFKNQFNSRSNLSHFRLHEAELSGLNYLGNALYELKNITAFDNEFYKPNLFIFSSHAVADPFTFDSFSKEKLDFSSIVIFSSERLQSHTKYEYLKLTENILNVEYLNEMILSMCLKFKE